MLFILVALGSAGIGWSLARNGWEPTWRHWGMVSRSPPFSDLEGVTGAMLSIAEGNDPLSANTGSIWHGQLNHPRLWFWLFGVLGIDERSNLILGPIFAAGLFTGLWWLTKGIGRDAALYCAAVCFSPVVMLAIERGNTDLFMFFLLAAACRLVVRFNLAALAVVLVAFMLKLFPLAGILLLLREPRERALRYGAVAVAAAAAYLLVIARDLPAIWSATEKGADVSYGYNVLPLYLHSYQYASARFAYWFARAVLLIGIGLVWWRHQRTSGVAPASSVTLDGYRLGAGIYAGTFLLGNSWDYRMIFFFFAVPQLFDWLHEGQKVEKVLAVSQLLAFLIATWAMWLTMMLPNHFWTVRMLEELAKWWLFFSSLHLLAQTLPGWARPWLRFHFQSPAAPAAPAR